MEKPNVITPSESKEYFTQEQCYILELLNSEKNEDLSIARARVLPGVQTEWHYLMHTSEYYLIIQGKGYMEISNEVTKEVCEGDIVVIPKGKNQRIKNIGKNDLIFYCICLPRWQSENYFPKAKV